MGMLLAVVVHPANVQDRDGAEPLLRQARRLFPFVERIIVSAATRPLVVRPDGQLRSLVAQCHGMSSSMRLLGQPLTRRVSTSVR